MPIFDLIFQIGNLAVRLLPLYQSAHAEATPESHAAALSGCSKVNEIAKSIVDAGDSIESASSIATTGVRKLAAARAAFVDSYSTMPASATANSPVDPLWAKVELAINTYCAARKIANDLGLGATDEQGTRM